MNKKNRNIMLLLAVFLCLGVFGFQQYRIMSAKKELINLVERNLDKFIGQAGNLDRDSFAVQYASLVAAQDAFITLDNQNWISTGGDEVTLSHLVVRIKALMMNEPDKFQSFFTQEGIGKKLYSIMDDFDNEKLVGDFYEELMGY